VAKFAACVVDTGGAPWLANMYLRKFSKTFDTVLMVYYGAGGNPFMKKTRSKKSRDTVPLNNFLQFGTDSLHCKKPIPKIRNKYSQKGNCAASVPMSTFICLWAIYILPPSVCLFFCRKYVDRSWEYRIRSQTHECRNWDWGRAIPPKGIHKWDFLCRVNIGTRYFLLSK
jgi:hypothetical protein